MPYIVLGEASTRRVVKKTSNLAVSLSVVAAFVVSFTAPYLTGTGYANLGGKVGYIYGSLTVLITVLTWWYVPEMKGRSLEELDVLFRDRVATHMFSKFEVPPAETAVLKADKITPAVAVSGCVRIARRLHDQYLVIF